mgnify:CR=1 FL=1
MRFFYFSITLIITKFQKIMGKFVIRTTATGFKFDLKAGNGQVILTSEVYTTKEACLKGIESVKKNGPSDKIKDLTVES